MKAVFNDVFLALDLELNQPSEKIIEIGITVGSIVTKEIFHNSGIIVNPNEKLDERIIALTTITQDQVDNGVSLEEAAKLVAGIQKQYQPFINPITWGQGDRVKLDQEFKSFSEKPFFGRREIDTKTLFVSFCFANLLKNQSGLAKSMSRIGLQFKGTKHRAVDDSYNTFVMYCEMLKLLKI